MRSAAIDIGSNSILLLIADVQDGEIEVLAERFFAPRLGQGLDAEGRLSDAAMDRAMEDLRTAVNLCHQLEVENIRAAATAAVREAANGREFTARVEKELGLPVRILSGEEEAELTYIGGVSGKDVRGPAALLDVGGASTEIIIGEGSCPSDLVSVPVGAVRFAERFGRSPGSVAKAVKWLEDKLRQPALVARERRLIGVGGTITTLAAVKLEMSDYDAVKINQTCLNAGQIHAIIDNFRDLETEEIAALPGMEPSRADIIEAGATIIQVFMRLSGVEYIDVSACGLRFGLLHQKSM